MNLSQGPASNASAPFHVTLLYSLWCSMMAIINCFFIMAAFVCTKCQTNRIYQISRYDIELKRERLMSWAPKGASGACFILVWEALERFSAAACAVGEMQGEEGRSCVSSKVKLQNFKSQAPAVLGARARWGAAERQSLPPRRFWEGAGALCPVVGQTGSAKRCREHWGCV